VADEGLMTTYDWVRRTRQTLLHHLSSLPGEAYLAPRPELDGQSVRDRHMHIAACYIGWTGRRALLEEGLALPDAAGWPDAERAWSWFEAVDFMVARLFETYGDRLDEPLERAFRDKPVRITARWALTHPMTHEFHHKGQIVVASRLLGYPAPDTDMVLPFAEA